MLTSSVPALMFDRMADNDPTPPEKQIADALNGIEEFTGVNVKKKTAQTAGAAYIAQQAAALGLSIPLALGGPAAISQEQTRRPDENQPAQSRGNAEPMRSLLVVATSTSTSSSLSSWQPRFEQGRVSYVAVDRNVNQDLHASEVSETSQKPQGNPDGEAPNSPKT